MFERILVALDGSDLAERVLPYVAEIAQKFGSAVTFLWATTPPTTYVADAVGGALPVAPPVLDAEALVEAERREAATYLNGVAGRLRERGLTVATEHPEGPAADT